MLLSGLSVGKGGSGSRVLTTGGQLSEVTKETHLFVGGPTLLLAQMLGGEYCVQVFASGVRWLRGDVGLGDAEPPSGRRIARASASDRYVLLLLDDGSPWLLEPSADCQCLAPVVTAGRAPLPTRLLSATLYEDRLDMFAPPTAAEEASPARTSNAQCEQPGAKQPAAEQPAARQPAAAEQPAAKQPAAAEQPAVKQPAAAARRAASVEPTSAEVGGGAVAVAAAGAGRRRARRRRG